MVEGETGCGACRDGNAFGIPFTMAFQPVVDTAARRIYSYEALVRGPQGESAGSILGQVTVETRYAFDQSCRVKAIELAASRGLARDRRLNINFMPNAVYDPQACIRLTLQAAERVGLPLDQITFEITEDERIQDHAHLQGIINEYRRHGFRIALDDFGAGYAGLNVLADIMPDVVKLDRAMIQDLDQNKIRRTIAIGMIKICQELEVQIVAEGVETLGEYAVLSEAGVHLYQGFLFAKPAFERLMAETEIAFP